MLRSLFTPMIVLSLAIPASAETKLHALPPRPPTWGEFHSVHEWPWTAIGRVNIARKVFCTGLVVAPRVVLTAAHCVVVGFVKGPKTINYKYLAPERLFFRAGPTHEHDFGRSEVVEVRVSPAYVPVDPRHVAAASDWALLVLKSPVSVKPLKLQRVSPNELRGFSNGGHIINAGYGWDRPFALSVFKGCRVHSIAMGSLYAFGCLTTFGYAGAPLMVFPPTGEPYVVAISSPPPWIIGMGHPGRQGLPPSKRYAFACPTSSFENAVLSLTRDLEPHEGDAQ